MKPPPIAFALLVKVFTLVGLPPTPCATALFLDTAERLWLSVIRLALASGTHFGYLRFASFFCLDLPHLAKDPSGVKRKDFRGSKAEGGLMEATARLKRQGLLRGGVARGCGRILSNRKKVTKVF